MKGKIASLTIVVLLGWVSAGRADFKYTEQSKLTGGMMMGMMKFAGHFSHKANQADQPVITTRYVKGNRLRIDNGGDNTSQIIDLDGRRMIWVDNQKRSYSVMTFDQMKAALENAQQQMKAKQQEAQQKGQNVQVTMTPKAQVTPTGNTRTILGQAANEVKVKIDMEMQATDTQKQQSGTANMSFSSDMWLAPGVSGYQEFQDFYKRMAQSIDWTPMGSMFSPQMKKGMEELAKNGSVPHGLPMLQYVSMFMAGQQGAQSGQQAQQGQESGGGSSQESASAVENPGAALAKGLGGLMGGFGRKKKQQAEPSSSASSQLPPPPPSSGSLMDITSEVTSYSADSLPASLFEIPAGYTQVEADPQKAMAMGQGKR